MNKYLSALRSPFWTHYEIFGLNSYPSGSGRQIVFWITAFIYSVVYLFLIAYAVVIFTHALWGWTGLYEYFVTTLFDVMYKNVLLVVLFSVAQSVIIFLNASRVIQVKPAYRKGKIFQFIQPAVLVLGIYSILKFFTRDYSLEPNVVHVLIFAYVVALAVRFIVDSGLPKR